MHLFGRLRLAVALALVIEPLAHAAQAQSVRIFETPYADVVALDPVFETFLGYAQTRFDDRLVIIGAQIGQILAGQTVRLKTGRGLDGHWVLDARAPTPPLMLISGAPGAIAAVVHDQAFGNFALAGVGPGQTGVGRSQLGTGIVTILFDEPQCLFGLRTALDGEQDNIAMRQFPEGNLNLIFWNEDGIELASFRRFLDQGVLETAYIQQAGSAPQIKAVTIQNLDPGGIGIDEIVYAPECPIILSDLSQAMGPG